MKALLVFSVMLCASSAAAQNVDPTQPKVSGTTSAATAPVGSNKPLRLRAIKMKSGQKLAIIGEQLVRQGDQVNGFTVEKILASSVLLRRDNELITLEMYHEKIKH